MTIWSPRLEEIIEQVLREVNAAEDGRQHLGRPYVTAYQLAIKVYRANPGLARSINTEIGGEGIGQHTSLANYLARELSRRIRRGGGDYFVEGAQLSSADMKTMEFRHPEGGVISNSLISARFDTTMFRLRADR